MRTIEGNGKATGERLDHGARPGPPLRHGRDGSSLNPVCDCMRRIALEEMVRRRRRLGELTPEQERALESLLMSVADNISELVSSVAARTLRHEHAEESFAPMVIRADELSLVRT